MPNLFDTRPNLRDCFPTEARTFYAVANVFLPPPKADTKSRRGGIIYRPWVYEGIVWESVAATKAEAEAYADEWCRDGVVIMRLTVTEEPLDLPDDDLLDRPPPEPIPERPETTINPRPEEWT